MNYKFSKTAVWMAVIVMAAALAAPMVTHVAAQGRVTRPQVIRPTGAVWQIVRKSCTQCHGIDDYAFFALDRAGWQKLIETKHMDIRVDVSGEDRSVLLDYLVSKFGPDSTPFPRTYVPPEITEFFTDPEATRVLSRACVSCHDLKRVNDSRFAPDRWRVIMVAMRERGAVLEDVELERLVEWLGRVKGINPNQ